MLVLERSPLRVEIGLDPLRIDVRRAGRTLLGGLSPWACAGTVHDRFIRVTEGVMAREELRFPERPVTVAVVDAGRRAATLALTLRGGRAARLRVTLLGDAARPVRARCRGRATAARARARVRGG